MKHILNLKSEHFSDKEYSKNVFLTFVTNLLAMLHNRREISNDKANFRHYTSIVNKCKNNIILKKIFKYKLYTNIPSGMLLVIIISSGFSSLWFAISIRVVVIRRISTRRPTPSTWFWHLKRKQLTLKILQYATLQWFSVTLYQWIGKCKIINSLISPK